MAKQNSGKPQIDENFMKEIISQGIPAKRDNQPDATPKEDTPEVEKETRQAEATHEKLMRIVTVIGGRKATASSYVENILLRHFEQFQDEINTLYESHFHKPF